MSRNALLEKIKRAEEVAASEVEKAEKERTTAMNRIPLDQEGLLKEKKDKAEKESKSEIDEAMKEIGQRIENSDSFNDIWDTILPESIDYGLMEKADNIYVIPAQFEWNDLGSWDALYEIFSKKENDNVIRGLGTVLEGENNFIQSNEKFTAVIGLDNIVVVNTNDATLVVPKDKVEKVKDLVSWLDKTNHEDLL